MIVDVGRVEARDRNGREESGEQIGTGRGEFVEDEIGASDFREDREQTGLVAGRLDEGDRVAGDAVEGSGISGDERPRGRIARLEPVDGVVVALPRLDGVARGPDQRSGGIDRGLLRRPREIALVERDVPGELGEEIGRASCRERVLRLV